MNILLTGVGGPAGLALAEQLATTDHHVVGTDMQEVDNPNIDAFELVPPANDPAMIRQLAGLVKRYSIDLLIPTVADELPQVAKAANLGSFGDTHVVIAGEDAVETCFDKYLTMSALREAGVSVPPFALPGDFTSAHEAFDALGPVIISKPRVGRGGRGFAIHRDPDNFPLRDFGQDIILQAFAPGEEYAPMVYLAEHGPQTVTVVEKTREEFCETGAPIISPVDSGQALDVATLAVRAATALRLTGPVDIDVRRMAHGHPVVLEVNARFGANSRLAPQLLRHVLDAAQGR